MRIRVLYVSIVALLLVLVSAASYAIAGTSASKAKPDPMANTVSACANNKTHALYLESRCPRGYSRVSWAVKGKNGANGTNGTNGVGAPGAQGPAGATGQNAGIGSVSINSISSGSAPSGSISGAGSNELLTLSLPAGQQGATGLTPWAYQGACVSSSSPYWPQGDTAPGGLNQTNYASGAASVVTYQGATYLYTGETPTGGCPGGTGSDPSNWTLIAQAGDNGTNGTANGWAVFDPGAYVSGEASSATVSYGGASGLAPDFSKIATGEYEVTVGGCTNTSIPSGSVFPAAINVTPEYLSNESSNDTPYDEVIGDASNPKSAGIDGAGYGTVEFYVYLSEPSGSGGPLQAVDMPFSVTVNC